MSLGLTFKHQLRLSLIISQYPKLFHIISHLTLSVSLFVTWSKYYKSPRYYEIHALALKSGLIKVQVSLINTQNTHKVVVHARPMCSTCVVLISPTHPLLGIGLLLLLTPGVCWGWGNKQYTQGWTDVQMWWNKRWSQFQRLPRQKLEPFQLVSWLEKEDKI